MTDELKIRRKKRTRAKIKGTPKRPRLCVFRSNKSVYVQIIDDTNSITLAAARLAEIKKTRNNMEDAKKLGRLVAQKCQKIKISKVVFDRAGYKYHGKVKAVAEGAREGGLKF